MPVKVYRYGLLPPRGGADIVRGQMRGAHRYYNTLVEIERHRREAVAAAQAVSADVNALSVEIATLAASLDQARSSLPRRGKCEAARDAREHVRALRASLREKRLQLRAAKKIAREDEIVRDAIRAANDAAHAKHLRARAMCGVYWGTYLIVEQAIEAARKSVTPPRFRAWRGDGAVAVELIRGLSVQAMLGCEDRRLQLDPLPVAVRDSCGRERRGKNRPTLRLRVGSDGRDPVWAAWPIIYHRPLPKDGVVKWARVVRRYVGGDEEWSLHLTLETAETKESCGVGAVAVDLGWRRNGSIRIGEWAGSDGRGAEVALHSQIEGALARTGGLRATRDQHVNRLKGRLRRLRDSASARGQQALPPEHADRLRAIGQWKSPRRFIGLAYWWRTHRVPGDWRIAGLLAAWLRREQHLWRWEAHSRSTALGRRRDAFRALAAQLARRYETLVVERLDLAALARTAVKESEREPTGGQNQRVMAAPSDLRQCLEEAFRARGGIVVTVAAGLGSARAMLAAFGERSGVEDKPVVARVPRFKRLRAGQAPTVS